MNYDYTSLHSEQREKGQAYDRSWKKVALVVLAIILTAVLSSMATVGIMTSGTLHRLQTASPRPDSSLEASSRFSCGETRDEAQRRGCTFDAITLSWLHPGCSKFGHQEFLDVSVASHNGSQWQYWEDRDGLKQLDGYAALSNLSPGSIYWTTSEAHLYHCVWMIWRVYDAAMTGKRLDAKKASSHEHMEHCLKVLADHASIGLGDSLTQIEASGHVHGVGWNSC